MKRLKWLYPGMKVKRWLSLASLGILLIVVGVSDKITYYKTFLISEYYPFYFNIILVIAGSVLIIMGIQKSFRSIVNVLIPEKEDEIVDMVFKKRQLEKGPKIVAIGGGTGLPIILQGIKEITSNITAIVTVADDGGSSGRLRKDFQVLPPGDIRNCLVSLANQELLMGDIFQHRFSSQSEDLSGHNFGNLFITAMTQVTGDFAEAIRQSSRVLSIRGQVIPATLENVILAAELEDGTIIEGESNIPKSSKKIKHVYLKPEDCKPNPECLKAIEEAEVIVFAPGSLYTSLLPNLIITDIAKSIIKSSALKIYVCNIMTQPGETKGFSVEDHVQVIFDHAGKNIFKYVLVNNTQINDEVLKRYKSENAEVVGYNIDELRSMGVKVIQDDFLYKGNLVRHDPLKLAKAIVALLIDSNIRQTDVYIKRRWGMDLEEKISKIDNKTKFKVISQNQTGKVYNQKTL